MNRVAIICMMLAASSAHALGAAGVAARGGIHRHCNDACLYRLDQEADRRATEQRERALRREAEHAQQMLSRRRPPLGDLYIPPAPKPPGPHAEAMGRVNILKGTP